MIAMACCNAGESISNNETGLLTVIFCWNKKKRKGENQIITLKELKLFALSISKEKTWWLVVIHKAIIKNKKYSCTLIKNFSPIVSWKSGNLTN